MVNPPGNEGLGVEDFSKARTSCAQVPIHELTRLKVLGKGPHTIELLSTQREAARGNTPQESRCRGHSEAIHDGWIVELLDHREVHRRSFGFTDRRQCTSEFVLAPDVIGVKKCKDLSPGVGDACVPRCGSSLIRLRQGSHTRITDASQDLLCAVCRAVINNNDLNVGVIAGLSEDALHSCRKVRRVVVRRYDDAHEHSGGTPFPEVTVSVAGAPMSVDVLHVVPAFYPTRGGIEVLVEGLAGRLNATSPRAHGVLAPRVAGERPDECAREGTPVFSVDAPHPEVIRRHHSGIEPLLEGQREFARILLRTRSIIMRTKPRVIHVHGLSAVGSAASVSADSLGIPVILHLHGSIGGALSRHMAWRMHTAVKVLAVSDFVRRSIHDEGGRTEEVHVVPNGLADPLACIHGQVAVGDENGPVVTMVGRLEEAKGFTFGLEACAGLLAQHPTLTVNIVGVGEAEESLRSRASELGIASIVRMHGRLERSETLRLLRGSSSVLVPSLAYEGFSLVALESAFLERPVVATRTGGLPETVVDGVTGTIVEPLDVEGTTAALARYLASAPLRRKHGAAGRERALRTYSLEAMCDRIADIHEDVLGGK